MAKAKPERVIADLRALARIGAYKTGVHKPALSPEHVASIDYFAGRAREAGLDVTIDGIGNCLCRGRGRGPRLLTGSHLESQNHAGWLDGPLGVIYGLEAARAIGEDPAFADCAVDVAAWCDEEGHFGHFMGSRSAVGEVSEGEIDKARDRTGGTPMRELLERAGYRGRPRVQLNARDYLGYFEAHIEQGDWLEAHGLKIGVVTSIVGITQFRITFEGVQNHAGTTRMAIRKDAGLAAAKLIVAIDELFPKIVGERTVWTTGRVTLDPGGPSIIPGKAELLFQFRDADAGLLERLEAAVVELVAKATRTGPCRGAVEILRKSPPAVMAEPLQVAIEAAAARLCPGKATRMPSGAGHDAQVLAKHLPSAMLFVPSIGGISHHWSEDTSEADLALGAEVYVQAAVEMLGRARG